MTEPEPVPSERERTWLARRLLPGGSEPDARFTLANERTFLAWMRTALALLGGGIALEAFAVGVFPAVVRQVAAVVLGVTALVVSVSAIARWRRVELAMRHGQPLPAPALALLVALGLTVASLILVGLILSAGR